MKTRTIVRVCLFIILFAAGVLAQSVEIRDGAPILHLNPAQRSAVDDSFGASSGTQTSELPRGWV